MGQRYDWYFTRLLISQIANSPQWKDHLPLAAARRPPRRLYDFDELYTAPAAGFESADDYYTRASAMPVIKNIRVHTTILASEDDPVVCYKPFLDLSLPTNVTLCLTRHGGHLGFVGRSGIDPDRRWMDWRLIDWLLT
jgi:predicted alpha/beta-fold hydrolase